jgi:hypothetical protein
MQTQHVKSGKTLKIDFLKAMPHGSTKSKRQLPSTPKVRCLYPIIIQNLKAIGMN